MPLKTVIERVTLALMGLPQRPKVRIALQPTLDGIRVLALPTPDLVRTDSAEVVSIRPAAGRDSVPAAESWLRPEMLGEIETAAEADAYVDRMARLRRQDADLVQRAAAEHAMALLARLQAEIETTGAVTYEAVTDVYGDLLIEMGWAPRPWAQVSRELRALTGGRKRYVNKPGGAGKQLVFDIPDPRADQLAETWMDGAAAIRTAMKEAA